MLILSKMKKAGCLLDRIGKNEAAPILFFISRFYWLTEHDFEQGIIFFHSSHNSTKYIYNIIQYLKSMVWDALIICIIEQGQSKYDNIKLLHEEGCKV